MHIPSPESFSKLEVFSPFIFWEWLEEKKLCSSFCADLLSEVWGLAKGNEALWFWFVERFGVFFLLTTWNEIHITISLQSNETLQIFLLQKCAYLSRWECCMNNGSTLKSKVLINKVWRLTDWHGITLINIRRRVACFFYILIISWNCWWNSIWLVHVWL